MTDKQIIIDICPYQGECSVSGCKKNDDGCFIRQLFEERDRAEKRIIELNKTIKTKEQDYEKVKQTLDIIKEIAENGCYDEYGMPLDELSIIPQKIREVEGCLKK